MSENKLEDLEFIDFDTSLTLSESAVDCAEITASGGVQNIKTVSKPAIRIYSYLDASNDYEIELDLLLDLPKATQLREWLNQFIEKHNKEI